MSKFLPPEKDALAAERQELNDLAARAERALFIYSADSMCSLLFGGAVGSKVRHVAQAMNIPIGETQNKVRSKIEDELYALCTECVEKHPLSKESIYTDKGKETLHVLCDEFNERVRALSVVCAELYLVSGYQKIKPENLRHDPIPLKRGPAGPALGT